MVDSANGETGYERLEVYQRSMRLMRLVHKLVLRLPDHERYGLVDQMRRASKSIPVNIAEGYARRSSGKEFARSLTIAVGSANEMEVHLKITRDLEYAPESETGPLVDEYVIVGKQLKKLMQYWRGRGRDPTTVPANHRTNVPTERSDV